MKKFYQKQKGMALLELLVYLAVLAITIGLVVNIILLMSKSYSKIRSAKQINESAVNIMERIVRETRWASSIDMTESVFDSNAGILSLDTASGDVRFSLENGKIKIFKNGNNDFLNTPAVNVTKFLLKLSNNGIAPMIDLELTLNNGKSVNFYNSVVVRGAY